MDSRARPCRPVWLHPAASPEWRDCLQERKAGCCGAGGVGNGTSGQGSKTGHLPSSQAAEGMAGHSMPAAAAAAQDPAARLPGRGKAEASAGRHPHYVAGHQQQQPGLWRPVGRQALFGKQQVGGGPSQAALSGSPQAPGYPGLRIPACQLQCRCGRHPTGAASQASGPHKPPAGPAGPPPAGAPTSAAATLPRASRPPCCASSPSPKALPHSALHTGRVEKPRSPGIGSQRGEAPVAACRLMHTKRGGVWPDTQLSDPAAARSKACLSCAAWRRT